MAKELIIKVLESKEEYFLIQRIFKPVMIKDYLVCEEYDFSSNTYKNGVASSSITEGYELFNMIVKLGSKEFFDYIKNENESDKDEEESEAS